MGQAFDERGNLLGEAFGATKREVFDKLASSYAEAAEIRIRKLMASPGPQEAEDVSEAGAVKSLSERVADLERQAEQLNSIRATLWLNYGDTPQNKAGFVIKRASPLNMMLNVLEQLTKLASKSTAQQ